MGSACGIAAGVEAAWARRIPGRWWCASR